MKMNPPNNAPDVININRRQLLLATAAIGSSVGLGQPAALFAKESKKQIKYRLGCSSRSFHRQFASKKQAGKMNLSKFIDQCAAWNCDCVELLDVHFPKVDDASLLAVKRKAFLKSVELSGVSVYTNFLQTKKSAFDAQVEKARQWIKYTAKLGAPLLVVFPGSTKLKMKMSQAVKMVSDGVSQLVDDAKKYGVMIGLENHGMLTRDAADVLQVVEKVNHPWFGINLDTGNFRQNTYKNMALLAAKAVNCHLKLDIHNGKKKEPADLRRKFEILRTAGYAGRVTLQYELKGNPFTDIPKHFKKMRELS